jgi:hypothetical protein
MRVSRPPLAQPPIWRQPVQPTHFLIFDKVFLNQAVALSLSKMNRIELHNNVGRTRLSTVCNRT